MAFTPRRVMSKLFLILAIVLLLFFGCLNLALNAHAADVATSSKPRWLSHRGAHDIEQLGAGWHTFRLKLGGRDHLFLRRLYSNEETTESLSEIDD
jgi:hypothetical protein